MGEPIEPVEPTESSKPEQITIASAYEKALEEHNEQASPPEPKEAPAKAAPAKPVSAEKAEEAEHIRWVKKVDGLVDKETGELNLDRIAKAYFEMNKGFQTKAQQVNQITQLLADPEIKAVIDRRTSGKPEPPAPKVEEKRDKTDEEILRDFIDERAKAIASEMMAPVNQKLQQSDVVIQKHVQSEINAAGEKMKEDYGSDEFEAMWPEIYQTVANAAMGQSMQPQQLINNLILNGAWLQTMQNIANNLVAPKYKTELAELKAQREAKELEAKKRTRLTTAKGSSEKSVREAVKVRSIRDAARAAEADHPEFAELK
jgi:hypothetical protein